MPNTSYRLDSVEMHPNHIHVQAPTPTIPKYINDSSNPNVSIIFLTSLERTSPDRTMVNGTIAMYAFSSIKVYWT